MSPALVKTHYVYLLLDGGGHLYFGYANKQGGRAG